MRARGIFPFLRCMVILAAWGAPFWSAQGQSQSSFDSFFGPHAGGGAQPLIIGVCTHFAQGKGNLKRDLDLIKKTQITSIRDEVYWQSVEQKKGVYAMPPAFEAYVNRAVALGIAPLLVLDYGNAFYDQGAYPTPSHPEAVEGYIAYASYVVQHFKGRVHLYEIWNEWDLGDGSNPRVPGTAEDYAALLPRLYPKLKAIDPSATIIGGSGISWQNILSPDVNWFATFAQKGVFKYMDGISIHPYIWSYPAAKRNLPAWSQRMSLIKQALAKAAGPNFPIYLTEMGWPNYNHPGAPTAEEVARHAAQLLQIVKAQPQIKGVWWYDLQDDGTDPANSEMNFGLINAQGVPKPAYQSFLAPP